MTKKCSKTSVHKPFKRMFSFVLQTYTLFQVLHISWQEVITQILVGFKTEQNGFQKKISKKKPQ